MAKEMIIEKQVQINKDNHVVFEFLKHTKHQDQFSVWNMEDPAMEKTYTGTDGTEGFTYSWNSKNKNVGAGTQEIKKIVNPSRIDYQIRFTKPMQNTADVSFLIHPATGSGTVVTWSFRSPTKFPMSLFSPILKKMLGRQMEQSLQNLKALLEK